MMLPLTFEPKERYPVMATRRYMTAAQPMEPVMMLVVDLWELLETSFRMENIYPRSRQMLAFSTVTEPPHTHAKLCFVICT